jgi:hypothetical protein
MGQFRRRTLGVALLGMLFTVGIAAYGIEDDCDEVLNGRRPGARVLYHQSLEVNLINFMDLAQEVSELAAKFLYKTYPSFLTRRPWLKLAIEDILTRSLQNAVEHGATEVLLGNYRDAMTNVELKVFVVGASLYFEVANPQIKSFPRALQRTFTIPEEFSDPSWPLEGYRGDGQGLKTIGYSMQNLSRGSTVSWSVVKGKIKFVLRVKLPRLSTNA